MNTHINNIANFPDSLLKANELCIWVPSNLLVLHQVSVPKAPRRKWLDLLPWILEEKLLQAPEDLHFTIAGKEKDKLFVFVAAKSQMLEWKNTLEERGLLNYKLIPDYLALPWSSGLLSIGQNAEHIIVRYGEYEGFSAPPSLAWHMISELLKTPEGSADNSSYGSLKLSLNMTESELP